MLNEKGKSITKLQIMLFFGLVWIIWIYKS